MMLSAGRGARVTVDTDGERADEAMAAILGLIASKFGEAE